MMVKCGKFYADWHDGNKRLRKAFKLKKQAKAYQDKMRAASHAKNYPGPAKPSAKPRPAGRKPNRPRSKQR